MYIEDKEIARISTQTAQKIHQAHSYFMGHTSHLRLLTIWLVFHKIRYSNCVMRHAELLSVISIIILISEPPIVNMD